MKYHIIIGYDRGNRLPSYVLAESIMQHSSVPVNFTFLHRDMLQDLSRPIEKFDSTEFSNNRFLTPYLSDYVGWSLFLDNDIVVQADIKELFDLADEQYDIMCVKHNYVCKNKKKFLGKDQHQYTYKNWSSVLLFNNSKCKVLSPEYVKSAPGLDLHQFAWIKDHTKIGSIPAEWNYLVETDNQTTLPPKLLHYTNGGPWFNEYKNCEYAEQWHSIYDNIKIEFEK